LYTLNTRKVSLQNAGSALLIALLAGCASQPPASDKANNRVRTPTQQTAPNQSRHATPDLRPFASVGSYHATAVSGDYAGYPA
jgi:hypothetical protein